MKIILKDQFVLVKESSLLIDEDKIGFVYYSSYKEGVTDYYISVVTQDSEDLCYIPYEDIERSIVFLSSWDSQFKLNEYDSHKNRIKMGTYKILIDRLGNVTNSDLDAKINPQNVEDDFLLKQMIKLEDGYYNS